jgi:nitroreductase
MKNTLLALPEGEAAHWTRRQPYIAGGNLMVACAELQIDSCPMEGFEAEKYNAILDLDKDGLNACLVFPVGYRSEADSTQHLPKTRRSLDQMFRHL